MLNKLEKSATKRTFNFTEEQLKLLQTIATERTMKTGVWCNVSVVIREAIDAYLDAYKKKIEAIEKK